MMSSLRAVSTVASLGPKHWGRLSSSALRAGSLPTLRTHVSSRNAKFSTASYCQSGHKNDSVETLSSKHGNSGEESDVRQRATTTDSHSTSNTTRPKSTLEASSADSFDEVISASRRIFSPSFGRDCQYRLITWQKKLADMERSGKPVNLKKILSGTFPDVVEFSLTPLAPSDVRLSVMKIVLMQPEDDAYAQRALHSASADVMQLSIADVAEMVRLLALAPPTELRAETRRLLVMAVVNRRWFEVGPKHLIFFMFQMDELFAVRNITQQLRQRSRSKGKQSKKKSDHTGQRNSIENTSSEAAALNHQASEISAEDTSESEASSEAKDLDSSLPVTTVNLESRAITLADELKMKDLARVVSLLSRWGSRNEPLLSACLHRLSLADVTSFSPAQLGSLLQAMANLSLHNSVLLGNVSKQLSQENFESEPSPAQVCAILHSLSALRWTGHVDSSDGRGLISACLRYLTSRLDKLAVKEAAGVLTSLANLSAVPGDEAERAVVKALSSIVLSGKSPWWGHIHCVWCLSVLKCLDTDLAGSVLNPQFVQMVLQKLEESSSSGASVVSANKLTQINMAARLEVKGYSGLLLSEEQLSLLVQQNALTPDQKVGKTNLTKTLRKFVDLMTYVDLNPDLPKGVAADALMRANSDGEVRPLGEQSDSAGQTEKTHLLAIQYVPFSGVTNPNQVATGLYQMSTRHLSMLGYTPVQVLFSDLKPSLSILEKVSNIKRRIRVAVQASTSSSTASTAASGTTHSDAASTASRDIIDDSDNTLKQS